MKLLAGQRFKLHDEDKFIRLKSGVAEVYAVTHLKESFRQIFLMVINIESQKTTTSIDYKLMKRVIYYVSRLISSQKEKEFHGDYRF